MKKTIMLILFVGLCLAAGALGSVFTSSAIPTWFPTIVKPSFNPPNWVFAPVWTTLYVLMGVSLWLVWRKGWRIRDEGRVMRGEAWNPWSERLWAGNWQKANIVAVFAVQLVLNVLWSFLFFGWHQIGLAFFEIIALWFAILYTIVNFYRVSKSAAWLLLPYILWVSFAAFLNYSIWMLNK